jgi:hypothetical protein
MKSKLIEVKQEVVFPCLARSNIDQLIVLFTSSRSGTVVQSNGKFEYCIGHYSPLWVDITENGWWEILPPGTKIELEQE